MSPDEVFERGLELSLSYEGGYVWDNRDPGGETHFGISKRAYPHLDIKNLTLEEAKEIYRRDYWAVIGADKLPPALAIVALDCAINHGPARALQWLAEGADDPVRLTIKRMQRYSDLKDLWKVYGRGWSRRAMGVLSAANEIVRAQA